MSLELHDAHEFAWLIAPIRYTAAQDLHPRLKRQCAAVACRPPRGLTPHPLERVWVHRFLYVGGTSGLPPAPVGSGACLYVHACMDLCMYLYVSMYVCMVVRLRHKLTLLLLSLLLGGPNPFGGGGATNPEPGIIYMYEDHESFIITLYLFILICVGYTPIMSYMSVFFI